LNDSDKVDKISTLYESLHTAIENDADGKIEILLKLISPTEDLFLKGYTKIKKEGVFYTKEDISNFIFSQALILFLNKTLEMIEISSHKDILSLDSELKKKIIEILLRVKICDPACGSGVFLLCAVHFIYDLIKKISNNDNFAEVKTQLLKNVYGFDINNYSIKLTILKLFNWYYKDYKSNISQIFSGLSSNFKSEDSLRSVIDTRFDIVVGNPPYGNILNKNQKDLLKGENIFYNDIYCAFILKVIDWCDGVIGLLVPKSFLLRQSYIKFRNILLKKANLLKIFDIGPNLFKKATNEVQILLYEKKAKNNKPLRIYKYPNEEIITYHNQDIDSLRICPNTRCPLCSKAKKVYVYTFRDLCPYCSHKTIFLNRIRIKVNNEIYNLINKLENEGDLNYLNIQRFPQMIRGEEDKGLKHVKSQINSITNGSCFFINAKEDFNYYHFKKNKSFDLKKIDPNVLKGVNYEFYTSPKLLIKHNNIYPQALFTQENICFTSSIYSLLHDDLKELKYLCSLLNSSVIQFYCIYGINNQKDTTINLNQYMIRHLPIKNVDEKVKKSLSQTIDNLIPLFILAKGEINNEITLLLRDIDKIIFQSYSISNQEQDLIVNHLKNQIPYVNKIYS